MSLDIRDMCHGRNLLCLGSQGLADIFWIANKIGLSSSCGFLYHMTD